MFGTIIAVGAAVGIVLPGILDSAEEIERRRKALAERAVRLTTGLLAREQGEIKEVAAIPFIEVPPDFALGGAPVLMTAKEAVWWMGASQKPEEHVAEIRGILQQQEERRSAVSRNNG